jgi:hypothetical protein
MRNEFAIVARGKKGGMVGISIRLEMIVEIFSRHKPLPVRRLLRVAIRGTGATFSDLNTEENRASIRVT